MMKLLRKLLLFILPAVIIAFVTIISITIYQTNELAKDNAQKIAQSSGESSAGKIESELDYSMDMTKSLASSLKSMVKNNEANRTVVDHMLRQLLEDNEGFVATWTAWEPNAFDGQDQQYVGKVGHDATGRYVPYWSRVGNDISVTALTDYEVEGAGDYYLLAKKTKQEVILEPYFYQIGNEQVLITSIVVPIVIDDQFLGVAGVDITLDTLQQLNGEVKLYESGFSSIVSNAGVIVAAANKELINEKLADKAEYQQINDILTSIQQGKSLIVEDFSTVLKKDAYIALSPIEVGDATTPWSLIVTVPIDEVMAAAKSQMWTLIAMSVIGIIVLIVVIVVLARRLVKPIIASVEQVKQIAAGNLNVEPLVVTSNDEIGELAVAMNDMTDNTRKLIQEAADISHQVSAYSEQLTTSTNEISISIDQVLTTTSELATGATVQAEHATSTLSVTQEVGRKVEEIKAYISEMIHRSKQTEQSSREGMTHAEASIQGMHSMSQTVHTTANVVNELADKSAEINRILQVIDDIAAQTNLLALNAAIEAARAGEHGKGFAVVADEVRKLAEESAKSTSQISGIIENVVRESQLAGQSMNGVVQEVEASARFIDANKQALDEIMNNIVSVVQQIELVTKASELIDQETQEVVRAVENITAISEESSAGSEELLATMQEQSASVTEINHMAKHLATMAESLQQSLSKFKY